MRFRLEARALQEFEDAVDHYLRISAETASRFVDAFEAGTDFIRQNPRAGRRVHGEIRGWNLRRFPYTLIYEALEDAVVVIAVMHMSREPEYWKTRRS